MKKLFFLLIGIIPFLSIAQDSETPKQVEEAFNKMFSNAEDILWTQLDDDFEASFYIDEEYKLALFAKNGKWIETATSINVEIASDRITTPIYDKYNGSLIDNIFMVETPENILFYRVQVDDGESVFIVKLSDKYEILESKKLSFDSTYDEEME
jgi:hypothetical protein